MKLLLLGKSGMLGSQFMKQLAGNEDFETFAFDMDLDITNEAALDNAFKRISPDFVINCAAYTNVDGAETDRETAMKVNGDALKVISRVCKRENAALVHFTTDYVFNGEKEGWVEDDKTDPINYYGETKLAGEKFIADEMIDYYIVRTSWLFGENGKNFVETMIRLGTERDELSIIGDQVGSPTYTHDLCEAVIERFLSPYLGDVEHHHEHEFGHEEVRKKLPFGIYHITNSGTCSWYEFAMEIFRIRGIDVRVREITSAEYPTAAVRPKNSALVSTKADFGMRSWQEAVKAYLG